VLHKYLINVAKRHKTQRFKELPFKKRNDDEVRKPLTKSLPLFRAFQD
jgi:hypothetical protein